MLYDRPYMQATPEYKRLSALGWLLVLHIGVFLIDSFFAVFFPRTPLAVFFTEWFALTGGNFRSGKVWTLVTYSFLHGGLLHIGFNLLITYGIGRTLQAELGGRRFLQLFFGGVFLGGVVALLVNYNSPIIIVGASGGVMALITIYCFQRWEMPVSLLFIEITFKLKWIFFFILGINLAGFLFQELAGRSGVAHSAHLGGALAGFLFYQYVSERVFMPGSFSGKSQSSKPRWFPQSNGESQSRQKRASGPSSSRSVDRKGLQAEVDRILDKINDKGFGSLSDEEKKTLDRARDILSR